MSRWKSLYLSQLAKQNLSTFDSFMKPHKKFCKKISFLICFKKSKLSYLLLFVHFSLFSDLLAIGELHRKTLFKESEKLNQN